MQALLQRAGNRRDKLMKWPGRFFENLLREALASDVTPSHDQICPLESKI